MTAGISSYTLVRDQTSTSITFARQTELTFPAVTICSLNLLNVTTLASFPGPRPAFRRLQYGTASDGKLGGGPGNEATSTLQVTNP